MPLKKKKFDICTLYVLLWIANFLQSLWLHNSFVSLLLTIPVMCLSVYYYAITIIQYKPKGVMGALSIFYFVLLIYGVALVILDNAEGYENTSFLFMLFASLGHLFSFYVFARRGILTENKIKNFVFLFLIVAVISFVRQKELALALALERNTRFEDTTNNAGYFILSLFPFVFLFKNKPLVQYLILATIVYYTIYSFKRGAIIICAILLLWFFYISFKTYSKRKRVIFLLLTVLTVYIGTYFVLELYSTNDYFAYRYESSLEGNDSGRDIIYSILWNHYIDNQNLIQLLFGEGGYHTRNVTGFNDAHNDWLELLIDCGLFVVFLYLLYWIRFITSWLKSKDYPIAYSVLGACFIFTFARTFFSMSFSDMPFSIDAILGFFFAKGGDNEFDMPSIETNAVIEKKEG